MTLTRCLWLMAVDAFKHIVAGRNRGVQTPAMSLLPSELYCFHSPFLWTPSSSATGPRKLGSAQVALQPQQQPLLPKSLRYHRPSPEKFRLKILQALCSRSSRLTRRSDCEAALISLVVALARHHQQPNPHINAHRSQPLHFPLCRSALHPFPTLSRRLRW